MNESLTTKPMVLVVDDQSMSRTLISAILRTDDKYNVVTATNGEEGMRATRTCRPDLLLLDVVMPGDYNGFDVCRMLKEDVATRRIPVVLITAQSNSVDRVQGIEAGADDFLAKPFNRIELLARVRSLIRIKTLNDQLDEVEDVIYALSRAVSVREGGDYEGETAQVALFARRLGEKYGLPEESLRILHQAAILRDIGKLGLPDRLLQKPGALNDEELHDMQRHVVLGEQIVSPLHSTTALLPIIRHHHERADGKGYPDGLAGKNIPLGARIVAIADAYVAMTSPRPYRPSVIPAKAISNLRAGAGKQWDSDLIDMFVKMVDEIPASRLALK